MVTSPERCFRHGIQQTQRIKVTADTAAARADRFAGTARFILL
jgi:hypothetical protein